MPGKALKVSDDPKIDMDEFLVLIPGDTIPTTQLSGKNIVGTPSATNPGLAYDAVSDTLPWSPVLLGRYAAALTVLPNVALLGTASAESINSSTNSADKANDGSYVTQWASNNSSAQHWWQLDLPARYRVSRWVVDMPGAGFQSGDFKLQSWSDPSAAWLDIDHVTSNSAAHVDRSVTAFDTTRVRVVVINNGISLPFGDTHARLNEVELYGYELVPVADATSIRTIPIDTTVPTSLNKIFTFDSASGLIKWLPASGGTTIASGTAFPSTPAEGDLFIRTDLAPYGLHMYHTSAWHLVGDGTSSGSVDATSIRTIPVDATAPTSTNNTLKYDPTSSSIKWLPDGAIINSGTAFPTSPAPAEGDLFIRTDFSPYGLHLYHSSSWHLLGDGGGTGGSSGTGASYYPIIPPVASDFSWIGQAGASMVTQPGEVSISAPPTALNVSALVKNTPATPYTVEAMLLMTLAPVNFAAAGLVLVESSTGKEITFELTSGNGALLLATVAFNSPTSANSTHNSTSMTTVTPHPIWMQIYDDGTTLHFSWSADGYNYTLFENWSRTGFLASGPNKIGFFTNPQNVTYASQVTLASWYAYSGAPSPTASRPVPTHGAVIATGTAFPSSPSDGDLFIRSDMTPLGLYRYATSDTTWHLIGDGTGSTIANGTAFPTTPADGTLFIRTDESPYGLHMYHTSTWNLIGDGVGSGGGIASGASWPTSPTVGDLFYRTDVRRIFYYAGITGAAWVSLDKEALSLVTTSGTRPVTGNVLDVWTVTLPGTRNILITDFAVNGFVNGANNTTSYWGFNLGTLIANIITCDTSTSAIGTGVQARAAASGINVVVDPLADRYLSISSTKHSTPGDFFWHGPSVEYRVIGPTT